MHGTLITGTLLACLAIAAIFWKRPDPPSPAPVASTAELAAPDASSGSVTVNAKIDRHWSEWNGEYALFAHRTASVRNDAEFTRLHLLIPAFTYGSFNDAAAAKLADRVRRFAADAGMIVEEEPRFALFHARFHADRNALALVPSTLATPLGLESATSLQRLALFRAPD